MKQNNSSKQIRTEIVINASKEKVWEVLTGFARYGDWNPFIVSISGKVEAGSSLTNTMMNGEKKMVFRPKVLSVMPNRSFSWLGSLGFRGLFDGHHYFELEELESGQVKLVHGERFSGILSSFILKKIGEETRRSFVRMNGALKLRAEALQQEPAPQSK